MAPPTTTAAADPEEPEVSQIVVLPAARVQARVMFCERHERVRYESETRGKAKGRNACVSCDKWGMKATKRCFSHASELKTFPRTHESTGRIGDVRRVAMSTHTFLNPTHAHWYGLGMIEMVEGRGGSLPPAYLRVEQR